MTSHLYPPLFIPLSHLHVHNNWITMGKTSFHNKKHKIAYRMSKLFLTKSNIQQVHSIDFSTLK